MEEMILFEHLEYGNYVMDDGNVPYTENVKYDKSDFNKLYVRRVKLPDGTGNLIYLMADNFDNSLRMISSNHFYALPSYRRVFYVPLSIGTFMKKRYRMNVMKEKAARVKLIKEIAGKLPYSSRNLPKQLSDNVYFSVADLYDAVRPIVQKAPTKRAYTEFIPEFISLIKKYSPEREASEKTNCNNRILIIDAEHFAFKPNSPLKENKTNPLYLIYLAYLRTRDLTKLDTDIDMLICSKNMFMKFNPSKLTADKWNVFRRFLFRIMNANLDDYTDNLTDEEKSELEDTAKDKAVNNIVDEALSPYTKNVQPSTKVVLQNAVQTKLRKEAANKAALNDEIVKATDSKPEPKPNTFTSVLHSNPVKQRLSKEQEKLFKALGGYSSLTQDTGMFVDDDDEDYDDYEDWEEEIKDDAVDIMQTDDEVAEEVLDEIQEHTAPMKRPTSPVNSKRDEKLREEQKKVVVRDETIEQILQRDSTNVPIQKEDKSAVMHTSNQNMKTITFANFDKTYIDELYTKDLVACFDSLKDKDSPFYITNIDIKDTSTALDYKETWTVSLRDETNKRHTIKVDIPKFQNDRFMLINGTRFIILKQNFYNPLVKDTPDTVILTTNFNKVTITRKATRSLSSVEKIFALIKKTGDNEVFTIGDSSAPNMRYISSLEYDELSRRLYSFKANGCELCFSRKALETMYDVQVNDDEFVIGMENGNPIIINEDTGLDKMGRTIIQIIEQHLPEQYLQKYEGIHSASQSMYVEAKMAGQFVPVISILMVWLGFAKALDRMGMKWRFIPNAKRTPVDSAGRKYIKFSDGLLEYESKTYAELIMNGVAKMHPEKFTFDTFNTEEGYEEFIYSQWGSYNGINELVNFNEFLVDPITEQVCKDLMLPNDPSGLLIHAVKLLSDNAYVSKACDKSYRVRSIEIIPAILYGCLSRQYKAYVKSGRRTPMTLNQRAVIQQLLAEKTVEAYSTLNPVVEVAKTHTISTKGYKGSNSQHSYRDEAKRSYDPSSVGKIAMTTSPRPTMIGRVILL